MLNRLRDRNKQILKRYDKVDSNYVKFSIIEKILEDDECFFKMNINDAYNILSDLGYKEDEIMSIYGELVGNPIE